MKQTHSLNHIISLWTFLGTDRRIQFFLLFILMIMGVFAEVVSIGAVIPFLSALTEPEILMKQSWFLPIGNFLDIKSPHELLFPLTVVFIGAAVFAAGIRILLLWLNSKLTASMGIQLRREIYSRVLCQPYEYHVAQNSSELVSIMSEKVGTTINTGIMHVLMFSTSLVTSIAIIITLLMVNTVVALTTFLILGGGYLFIGYLVRSEMKENGDIISKNQPRAVQLMQEGLGGIQDIIIDNSQNEFIKVYTGTVTKIQTAGMKNSFLSNLPKSVLEMLGITLIALLALYLQKVGTQSALPILGALALGSQRLLPALQQIYYSWSTINGNRAIILDVLNYLNQPLECKSLDNKTVIPLEFKDDIKVENVSFKYRSSNIWVMNNIKLEIIKGTRIGFIGSTGSGKSTLLDIIMGLLSPTQGEVRIDGIPLDKSNTLNWQANIAHVPQSIFLSDTSITENIAFGVSSDSIDFTNVKEAAKQANIDTFIEGLPKGYETSVGERGIQLSGGQRQRIGIARALYKKANLIVFDEATSALDDTTETSVMQSINSLDKSLTIIIIAHRLSTLKGCEQIYKLEKGTIVEFGTYDEIVNKDTFDLEKRL